MLDASLLLLKCDTSETPAHSCDLLQFRRPSHLLRNDKLLLCRERSPAPAVFRPEAGVVITAEGLDRVAGLLDLGHRFGQTSPDSPAHILSTLFARFFQFAVKTLRFLLFLCSVDSCLPGF